jgi:mannan endo-1,4-beta-mannosidase
VPDSLKGPFEIIGDQVLYNDTPAVFNGVNAMQTFGAMSDSLFAVWNVAIVREFVGNVREQPIAGSPILGADGKWLHSLQSIVDRHRAVGRITVLCPFGWVDDQGNRQLFTGLNPLETSFYEEYSAKMLEWALQFKDQPDVWIEVWNEPFHWDNQNGYSHELWLETMEELIDQLRWVEGFENIILVPGNEQGQGEDAILTYGEDLLEGRYNVLFDLHAYEKWLVKSDSTEQIQRIQAIMDHGFALTFGEVGVHNVSDIMDPSTFLKVVDDQGVSTMGWLFVSDGSNSNALMDDQNMPNAHSGNAFWGTTFQSFLLP